jgi:surfeit locus 1 family protein
MIFLHMFTRRWILATLLVAFGVGLCIRLGIWQLDRLDQRRAFNARVQAQIDQPALTLDANTLQDDIANMEYRQVQVTGKYDFSQEIALRNQYYGNEWGVHLITPLKIADTDQTILVDRGWIPAADFETGDWSKFAESGVVTVSGVLRAAQTRAQLGTRTDPTPAPGEAPRQSWNFVNISLISRQFPYPLLEAYIQQAPNPSWTGLPYRTQPELELTEGPHMGYALQWFTFATILGIGYPFFLRRQEKSVLTASAEAK